MSLKVHILNVSTRLKLIVDLINESGFKGMRYSISKYGGIRRLHHRTEDHHRRYQERYETGIKGYPDRCIREELAVRESVRMPEFQRYEKDGGKSSAGDWLAKSF